MFVVFGSQWGIQSCGEAAEECFFIQAGTMRVKASVTTSEVQHPFIFRVSVQDAVLPESHARG